MSRLITIVLVVLLAVAGTWLMLPDDSDEPALRLVATFRDASPLLAGNDVRSHGVKVGTIRSIGLENGKARVEVDLERTALPVHEDARLTIRPVSLLGERFLDLDSGTESAPLMQDGGRVPESRTGSSVGLDQVVDTLDAPTSASLGLLVQALGVGMDKNGKNVQDAIAALEPALTQSGQLTRVLRDQNKTLGALVSNLEPVAAGLASEEGADLDRLVAASNDLLHSTAADDAAFRAMLAELPGTLRQAQKTLGILHGTARTLTPTLTDLRPTTSQLRGLSRDLNAFGDAADPAFRSAVPVLAEAEKLLQAARPVAASLRRGSPALRNVATDADPVTRELGRHFTPVMEFFKRWALTTNGRDGLSHYFRAGLVLSPRDSTGLPASAPVPGTQAAAPSPLHGLNGLTNGLTGALPGLEGLLGGAFDGLLNRRADPGGGVTGLSDEQESAALGFLLGGE